MKILTVLGARPQFIKAAPVSRALMANGIQEILLHTGQHYDPAMSAIFFDELRLPKPDYQLKIGSGSHAYQVGQGLIELEPILKEEKPDLVMVYGDTNATIAGALAASQQQIPVAHIEAGLRSFNRQMIEEINRVTVDHLSRWLFAPTAQAVRNLQDEGIRQGVYATGDVMLDACRLFLDYAQSHNSGLLETLGLSDKSYYLLTMHRAESTAQPEKVASILQALDTFARTVGKSVLFPVHPRIASLVESLKPFSAIQTIEPLGYLDMLLVESSACGVVTDSGGVQKEAGFMEVPCITLRQETEWVETVESGWNTLVGLEPAKLLHALEHLTQPNESITHLYGDGGASQAICAALINASLTPA